MARTSSRLFLLAALPGAAALLAACRTHAGGLCFPERGAEVWVERHYSRPPGSGETAAPGVLSIRLLADSGTHQPLGRQAIVAALRGGPGGTGPSTQVNERGEARLGALMPGVYTVRLREILYVGMDRPVDVGPGERVELDVRMRHAAYCLGPVVRT